MTDAEFDRDVELAAAGDWEALGLDPPNPATVNNKVQGFEPSTVTEFMQET